MILEDDANGEYVTIRIMKMHVACIG